MVGSRSLTGRWLSRSSCPDPLVGRVRAYAAEHRLAISAVVAAALVEFLARDRGRAAGPVTERAVRAQWVFHRHAEVELSVVYDILVPQRSARSPAGRP